MKKYYTYAYLREDKTPYYIGKGKGNRVYKRKKGEIHPPKDKSRIIFLKKNITEEEAFRHEIYMIAVFGRKDLGTGILRNRTDGGDGPSGAIRSKETRQKMSEAGKGRIFTEEHRKNIGKSREGRKHSEQTKIKMREKRKGRKPTLGMKHSEEFKDRKRKKVLGEGNPFYGKTHTKDVREKLSSPHKKRLSFISPSGEIVKEFTTIKMFCKKYNLCRVCVSKLIKGKQKYHKGWTFLGENLEF